MKFYKLGIVLSIFLFSFFVIPNSKAINTSLNTFKTIEYSNEYYLSNNLTLSYPSESNLYKTKYYTGNYTNYLNCSYQNSLLAYDYTSQSNYTKYIVNQFYFNLTEFNSRNITNYIQNYTIQLNYESNNTLQYFNTFNFSIQMNNISISNNIDYNYYNYTFDTTNYLDIQLHTYFYNNYTFSRAYFYNDTNLLFTYYYSAIQLNNLSGIENIYLHSFNFTSNCNINSLKGIRFMYINQTIQFSNFINFPLWNDDFFYNMDISLIKLPFWLWLILTISVGLIWMYVKELMRINNTQIQYKLKVNLIFTLIEFILILLLTDRISIYLVDSDETSLIFTLLNALLFGMYLNICGLASGGLLKKSYMKFSVITIVLFSSLFVFGIASFYIEFNYPFNLLLFYNKFSTSTLHGLYFYEYNFFGLLGGIYLLSFILESEV